MKTSTVPRTEETRLFEGLDWTAIPGFAAALIAGLGWWNERRKDRKAERRSDLDILLGGFERLLNTTDKHRTKAEQELAETFARARDCEEREKALDQRVFLLERELRRLGGNV